MSFSDLAAEMDADLCDAFGEPADYRAGGIGAPRRVLVVVDRPTADAVTFGVRLRADARTLQFLAAAIAAPVRGDTFTLEGSGEVLTIAGAPALDAAGTLWTAEG